MLEKVITNEKAMHELGRGIGNVLVGGLCIELLGDLGAGKTTLMKGVAEGLAIDEEIQSPSFTLSREYEARDGLRLAHYDLYRLQEPGVVAYELAESLADPTTITAIEWAAAAQNVLPDERIIIHIRHAEDVSHRDLSISIPNGAKYQLIQKALL